MKINQMAVFREEPDGRGCLFNPDDGKVFGLNRTACMIWKELSAGSSIAGIISMLKEAGGAGEGVEKDVDTFISSLRERGFLEEA